MSKQGESRKQMVKRHEAELRTLKDTCWHTQENIVVEDTSFGSRRDITIRCTNCGENLVGYHMDGDQSYFAYVKDSVANWPGNRPGKKERDCPPGTWQEPPVPDGLQRSYNKCRQCGLVFYIDQKSDTYYAIRGMPCGHSLANHQEISKAEFHALMNKQIERERLAEKETKKSG